MEREPDRSDPRELMFLDFEPSHAPALRRDSLGVEALVLMRLGRADGPCRRLRSLMGGRFGGAEFRPVHQHGETAKSRSLSGLGGGAPVAREPKSTTKRIPSRRHTASSAWGS